MKIRWRPAVRQSATIATGHSCVSWQNLCWRQSHQKGAHRHHPNAKTCCQHQNLKTVTAWTPPSSPGGLPSSASTPHFLATPWPRFYEIPPAPCRVLWSQAEWIRCLQAALSPAICILLGLEGSLNLISKTLCLQPCRWCPCKRWDSSPP